MLAFLCTEDQVTQRTRHTHDHVTLELTSSEKNIVFHSNTKKMHMRKDFVRHDMFSGDRTYSCKDKEPTRFPNINGAKLQISGLSTSTNQIM